MITITVIIVVASCDCDNENIDDNNNDNMTTIITKNYNDNKKNMLFNIYLS